MTDETKSCENCTKDDCENCVEKDGKNFCCQNCCNDYEKRGNTPKGEPINVCRFC